MIAPQNNDPIPQAAGPPRPACPTCGGSKEVTWKDENGDVKRKTCPSCHGSGVRRLRTK